MNVLALASEGGHIVAKGPTVYHDDFILAPPLCFEVSSDIYFKLKLETFGPNPGPLPLFIHTISGRKNIFKMFSLIHVSLEQWETPPIYFSKFLPLN